MNRLRSFYHASKKPSSMSIAPLESSMDLITEDHAVASQKEKKPLLRSKMGVVAQVQNAVSSSMVFHHKSLLFLDHFSPLQP